jgi:membrane protein DedA with SNARE-associated domain
MDHVLSVLMQYGYVVVFGVILLENLGLPLPGLAVLIVAGALVGGGRLSLPLVAVLAVAGALIGDIVWYGLGRWRGRPILGLLCRLSLNPDTCVGATERFFLRHGMRTLLVAKFLPGVNTIVPPLMGTLRARLASFLAWDVAGAMLFTLTTVGLGYILGDQVVGAATAQASALGTLVGWGFVAFVGGYLAWRLALRLHVRRALRTVGITPRGLHALREEGSDVLVVDVRSPLALKENPRIIPGAIRAAAAEVAWLATTLPRERPIVTYCV